MLLSRSFHLLTALSTALLLTGCGDDASEPVRTVLAAESGEGRSSPRFSPDGSHIAYVSWALDSDTRDHWAAVMHADGTDSRGLTRYSNHVAWNADGTRIFYTGSFGKVFSVSREGGEEVLEHDEPDIEFLDVSPDGRALVYSIRTLEGGVMRGLDLTTRAVSSLVEGRYSRAPVFSPDGTRVAYLEVASNGIQALRVLTLATGGDVLVANEVGALSSADWLPDGRLAAIVGNGVTFFDLSGATPQGRQVYTEPGIKELDVSPDGKKMVYAINGRSDLFVLTGY